jgi:predicted nucleic acid-binding protein
MTAPVFVDTNVFIYAVDEAAGKKHESAKRWRAELWKTKRGRVSFQVLQEFYVNIARKWPVAAQQAQAEIRDLFAWKPVAIDAEILERSWKIQHRYNISFWDAMIASAARAASCRYLLTEDLQADQDLDGVIVINPFRSEPAEILKI